MTPYIFYNTLMPWFYGASVVTFILFAYDKHCACYGKWRVPEFILMLGSLFMGAFGGLCGMILFNHKTSKKMFAIAIPVMLLLQTLLAVLLIVNS